MVGPMAPWMKWVVEFWDRSMGRGNFGGKCGAPHCNHLLAVRKYMNRRSCCLGWCMRSAEALVATRPVPKLLWAILFTFVTYIFGTFSLHKRWYKCISK